MRSYFAPILCLLFLASAAMAQDANDTPKRMAILADFSDRAQFALENQLLQAISDLASSGQLKGLADFDSQPQIINTSQPDGKALLSAWGLTQAELPLLALTDNATDLSAGTLLWYWKVQDVPSAIGALSGKLGVGIPDGPPLIRAADFSPRNGPLSAGQAIFVTVQGTPNGTATADIGGVQGVVLFEEQQGLYKGSYLVKSEDRTDAAVVVHLATPGRAPETRLLGNILLQGVQAPSLQSVRQTLTGEWIFSGTATPNSRVNVDLTIKQTFIFKFKSNYKFEGTADAQGQFQITAVIQDQVAGENGNFKVTSSLNGASETSEQRLAFQGRSSGYSPPGGYRPAVSPWSLAGRWYHRGVPTSIRGQSSDSVVIRNENGLETQMWFVGPQTISARGTFPLTGQIDANGNNIRWSNGTSWNR